MDASIPYEVTARKKTTSTLDESAVKLYLTTVDGNTETEVLLDNYDNLDQTSKVSSDTYTEKTIYTGRVQANQANYEQNFRLRMWIDSDVKFSPNPDGTYPYNDKSFTVTVNVYANAKVVTEEDINNQAKAEISSLSVDGTELVAVEGQSYDYEMTLPEGTVSTTIDVETVSEYATVEVEKLDSLAYSSSVKRLSSKKTLDLVNGDNYFKITVTSENGEVENEYKLKVFVGTLSGAIFNRYTTIYENPNLKTSSNNTSDPSGLYKSTATNFNGIAGTPTYYFRGNVENNYVEFADFIWRIVRINEDGINGNATYKFNPTYTDYTYMYYSKSSNDGAKHLLDSWYDDKISSSGLNDKVASGNYFCEQAKVKLDSTATFGNATVSFFTNYSPDFKCVKDGNGYGIVDANIGLLTYDEIVHAGGYGNFNNNNYYLVNDAMNWWWTMSPGGVLNNGTYISVLGLGYSGNTIYTKVDNDAIAIRPVINLKVDIKATGNGTSTAPWVVQ